MLLAFQRTIVPAAGRPSESPSQAESRLNIDVVFTSVEDTLSALRKAAELANRLTARITLIVLQTVPYPLPLDSPPVLLDWNERRLRVIAEKTPVETRVHIYLCRDRVDTLMAVLKPQSIVVLGSRERLWPTAERRLARKLRAAGHEVILAETSRRS